MKDWVVYGSNDNSTWTQKASGTNSTESGDYNLSLSSNTSYYKYYKIAVTSHTRGSGTYVAANNVRITATYLTASANSITYPQAFSTVNYAYSLAYLNGIFGESYATSKTETGMTLQNNSNATSVYYMAIGY